MTIVCLWNFVVHFHHISIGIFQYDEAEPGLGGSNHPCTQSMHIGWNFGSFMHWLVHKTFSIVIRFIDIAIVNKSFYVINLCLLACVLTFCVLWATACELINNQQFILSINW